MKTRFLLIGSVLLAIAVMGFKTEKMKKIQSYSISVIIKLPAEKVWTLISKDYGSVQNYADQIHKSEYTDGYIKGGENCQRICYLNSEQTTYYKEKMVNVDNENMSYTNIMTEVGKLPIVPGVSKTLFKVVRLTDSSCELIANSEYRTKPALMGVLFKGKFKATMTDYLISVASYAQTGVPVTKENFKEIKKDFLTSQP
ncbi:MAG: hypothetical protein COA58_14980 [Bacteroidetes bacterium]|nr:MAG: hypothetical protein COA58_14980 [Bacteroidota bacterium]